MDAAVNYSIVNRSTSLEDAVDLVEGDSVADERVVAGGLLKKDAVLTMVADGVIAKYVIVGVLNLETIIGTVVDCVADEGAERGPHDCYAGLAATISDDVAGQGASGGIA